MLLSSFIIWLSDSFMLQLRTLDWEIAYFKWLYLRLFLDVGENHGKDELGSTW